ncbi:hypothetical protein K502DRAFT_353843 [Neoconidiobolus thromboides FSU 785]|nr:hypothetical protein K502DRAFT_353843 [Neoconidiobolus thromboides FSU 785]
MASPHVSGAALLVIAGCPHLSRKVDLIAKVLHQSATPVLPKVKCGKDTDKSIPNNEYGYGVINVGKALKICKTIVLIILILINSKLWNKYKKT